MIGLIQRVSEASVCVDGEVIGSAGRGLLVLLGVQKGDDQEKADRLLDKILRYRVFPDDEGRMNRSISDIDGDLLVVSQFTLAADTRKGTRPGFSGAAAPDDANSRAAIAALVRLPGIAGVPDRCPHPCAGYQPRPSGGTV